MGSIQTLARNNIYTIKIQVFNRAQKFYNYKKDTNIKDRHATVDTAMQSRQLLFLYRMQVSHERIRKTH